MVLRILATRKGTGNLFKAIIVCEDQETCLANIRIKFFALFEPKSLLGFVIKKNIYAQNLYVHFILISIEK